MPRKDRITSAGFYHVVCRGVERRNVFLDSDDFEKFLEILKDMKDKFHILIHSFCLMSNHYHILLETKEENISSAMRYLNSHYAIYFNKKYNRTGHLWQGRFHSNFLYDEEHFWYVAKYIERNPVKAKIVKDITHYKFQSFFQWKYKGEFSSLLEGSKILDLTLFEYESYISSDFDIDISELIYTSPKFIRKNGELKILYKRLITFFEEDKDINRDKNIRKAYAYGYTKSEIAYFLSLSSSAISKILK